MNEDKLTPYEQFHHDSKWLHLNLLLVEEYRTEGVRRALRAIRTLDDLRKLNKK